VFLAKNKLKELHSVALINELMGSPISRSLLQICHNSNVSGSFVDSFIDSGCKCSE